MNICCVIVTFNRLNKLKKSIESILTQSLQPTHIVIVNNNSTDGTSAFLNEIKNNNLYNQIHIDIINLSQNLGGSAGFYLGMEAALKLGVDYIWISDDDAYLDNHCLQILTNAFSSCDSKVGALCSSVYENGRIAKVHRRKICKSLRFKDKYISEEQYNEKIFEIDLYTYVGVLFDANKLNNVGLPEYQYFIWYDDTEHSLRFSHKYKIMCVPEAKVVHDVDEIKGNTSLNWKSYYGYRNRLHMIKKNCNFSTLFFELFFFYIKMFKDFFTCKNKYKMKKNALQDYRNNNLGKSQIYYPGKKF